MPEQCKQCPISIENVENYTLCPDIVENDQSTVGNCNENCIKQFLFTINNVQLFILCNMNVKKIKWYSGLRTKHSHHRFRFRME